MPKLPRSAAPHHGMQPSGAPHHGMQPGWPNAHGQRRAHSNHPPTPGHHWPAPSHFPHQANGHFPVHHPPHLQIPIHRRDFYHPYQNPHYQIPYHRGNYHHPHQIPHPRRDHYHPYAPFHRPASPTRQSAPNNATNAEKIDDRNEKLPPFAPKEAPVDEKKENSYDDDNNNRTANDEENQGKPGTQCRICNEYKKAMRKDRKSMCMDCHRKENLKLKETKKKDQELMEQSGIIIMRDPTGNNEARREELMKVLEFSKEKIYHNGFKKAKKKKKQQPANEKGGEIEKGKKKELPVPRVPYRMGVAANKEELQRMMDAQGKYAKKPENKSDSESKIHVLEHASSGHSLSQCRPYNPFLMQMRNDARKTCQECPPLWEQAELANRSDHKQSHDKEGRPIFSSPFDAAEVHPSDLRHPKDKKKDRDPWKLNWKEKKERKERKVWMPPGQNVHTFEFHYDKDKLGPANFISLYGESFNVIAVRCPWGRSDPYIDEIYGDYKELKKWLAAQPMEDQTLGEAYLDEFKEECKLRLKEHPGHTRIIIVHVHKGHRVIFNSSDCLHGTIVPGGQFRCLVILYNLQLAGNTTTQQAQMATLEELMEP